MGSEDSEPHQVHQERNPIADAIRDKEERQFDGCFEERGCERAETSCRDKSGFPEWFEQSEYIVILETLALDDWSGLSNRCARVPAFQRLPPEVDVLFSSSCEYLKMVV